MILRMGAANLIILLLCRVMIKIKRKLAAWLLVSAIGLSIAGILFLYYRFDPAENILFPKCIFHTVTGLECPGCGSQRAFHQLLSGNIAEAFKYNALVVVSIPYLGLWALLTLWKMWSKSVAAKNQIGRAVAGLYHGKAVYIILFVVIIFWITRNFSPAF